MGCRIPQGSARMQKWLDRLLYACEIQSLRVAQHAWRYARKRQDWQDKIEALKKSS